MKKHRVILPVLFIAALLAGICLLAGCSGSRAQAQEVSGYSLGGGDPTTIPDGVCIGEVELSGMTASQAASVVRGYVGDISDEVVTLVANGEVLKASFADLGVSVDIDSTVESALNYGRTGNVLKRYKAQKDLEEEEVVLPVLVAVDEEQARAYLEEHINDLSRTQIDYGLTLRDGEFVIEDGETGQTIDVDECVQTIENSFVGGWEDVTLISLPVEIIEPKGSHEELALVQDVLGEFTTYYSSSGDARKNNIMVGADLIDGAVIYPGETYSVESAVAPFDEAHGYEEAASYETGSSSDIYGGGICQVSTTLYNAAIRAELEIDERHGFFETVSYVDPSDDAAISEGEEDLQFTNNTDAPIYISAYANEEAVSFTIYGHETRPANRSVSFESVTVSTVEPTEEYQSSDDSYGYITVAQESHTGVTAELWKVVTVDGEEESRELFNETVYEMVPAIYNVGVSTYDLSAQLALYDAIDSQDIDEIYSTIDKYTYSSSSSSSSSGSGSSGYSDYSGSSGYSDYSDSSGYSDYSDSYDYSGSSGSSDSSGWSGWSDWFDFSDSSDSSGSSGYSDYSDSSGYSDYSDSYDYSGSSDYSDYSDSSGYSDYSDDSGGSDSSDYTDSYNYSEPIDWEQEESTGYEDSGSGEDTWSDTPATTSAGDEGASEESSPEWYDDFGGW